MTEISKIAIDPSINNIGWAVEWQGKVFSGAIETKGVEIEEKLCSLRGLLRSVLLSPAYPLPSLAVVEQPAPYAFKRSTSETSGKGLNNASLQKLNIALGAIISTLCEVNIREIKLIPVAWKGKMNKKMAMALTGAKNHNTADAILLLRY